MANQSSGKYYLTMPGIICFWLFIAFICYSIIGGIIIKYKPAIPSLILEKETIMRRQEINEYMYNQTLVDGNDEIINYLIDKIPWKFEHVGQLDFTQIEVIFKLAIFRMVRVKGWPIFIVLCWMILQTFFMTRRYQKEKKEFKVDEVQHTIGRGIQRGFIMLLPLYLFFPYPMNNNGITAFYILSIMCLCLSRGMIAANKEIRRTISFN